MTAVVDVTTNGVPQERRLVTEVPGPRSQALQARKTNAVSAGVGVTLPVYVERAGGDVGGGERLLVVAPQGIGQRQQRDVRRALVRGGQRPVLVCARPRLGRFGMQLSQTHWCPCR